MGIMWVAYDVFHKGETNSVRGHACYADLFYLYGMAPDIKDVSTLKAYYWLDNNEKTKEDADWFARDVIPYFTPKHLKDVFSFVDEVDVEIDRGWPGKPWGTLTVDLNKITSDELYVLLALYRYPQENPEFASVMRGFAPEYGLDLSYMKAHAEGADVGTGHLLINIKTKYLFEGGGTVDNYCFKDIWENLRKETKNSKPYTEKPKKYATINEIFSPVKSK